MKRKFLALFLTATLAFSFAACGNDSKDAAKDSAPVEESAGTEDSADAELPEAEATDEPQEEEKADIDPIAEALKNMDSVTSMEAKMVMDMDMNVSADGQEQSIASTTDMDMFWIKEPLKIKMDMTMEAAGQSTQMSIYAEPSEDGTYVMYIFDGTNWQSQATDIAELADYDARSTMVDSIGDGSDYTAEGMEQLDSGNAYKYSYVMTGEETKEALLSSGALDSVSSLGIDSTQLDSMLDGLGDITTYVWVDEATLYPVKYEMDMTDVMNALMTNIVAAMGEQAEGMSMTVPKLSISMTCSNFNNVADFTVPEEAKAN